MKGVGYCKNLEGNIHGRKTKISKNKQYHETMKQRRGKVLSCTQIFTENSEPVLGYHHHRRHRDRSTKASGLGSLARK